MGGMRARLILPLLLLSTTVFASPATAQKGVVGIGADQFAGVASVEGDSRYATVGLGDSTVVERIHVGSGEIEAIQVLGAAAVIPAVAYDGTAGGLSFDGQTLVLPEPAWRFPQRESRFNVLTADRLRTLDPVVLDGTWTYDALSPDGRWLYLIEYTSPRDISEYEVRAYDLRERQLDPEPVVDPEEAGEEMYGMPITRASSPDGRWAYTLYQSAERHHPPFIHALDTVGRTAVCIDLDLLADHPDLFRVDLQPSADGSSLAVVKSSSLAEARRGDPLANVDLGSFEVSEPAPAVAPTDLEAGGASDGISWIAIAAGAVLLVVAVSLLGRRRREHDQVS
jgi:hypothetical protein